MMWEKGAFTVSGGTGPWQQRSDQTSLRRMGMRIPLMRMRRKMSWTARIDDKQICLSSETCIFISFVHSVQILHNVWVRRLVHYALCTKHFVQCTFHYALCTWCTLYSSLSTCVQIGTSANGAGQVRGMWLWTQLLEYELSWTLLEYESLWTLLEQTLTERAHLSYMLVST